MNEMIPSLNQIQEEKKAAVLCMVIESVGSTPRKAGSKMLVLSDGSIEGSVGGGVIEQTVIAEALQMMNTFQIKTMDYELGSDLSMHCGGSVKIYFEAINSLPRLLIFGAGHIGKMLAEMALPFGFDVHLIDNRTDIFIDKNSAINYIGNEFPDAWESMEFQKNDFVVVTTYKHDYDAGIVDHVLSKPHAYLGMMASKRKAAKAQNKWLESGHSEEAINKVYSPIGLKIQCETPREIALSILAQLVDEVNKMRKA
ncbi:MULTISPECIES: XdhC family protein [unclassified Lentimicrobium]|uniref:XdhC family protein n=1 Tax=unclassified Lentimicrobium TaxID=2677434 RepID=UPI0015572799|nr:MULTISPECIES: XdhC family protein [unclassified Lentimicrobium]NPD47727.1 XdhC family protein [Lentimicrobium sp. S6]NPD83874.1 XdhC family protein [Lentimicrobium sp. L6]